MSWIAWIVLGVIAGLIARAIVPGDLGGGVVTDLVVGVAGALLGGWIGRTFFHASGGVNGLNLHSFLLAILGAIVLLVILRLLPGKRNLYSDPRD